MRAQFYRADIPRDAKEYPEVLEWRFCGVPYADPDIQRMYERLGIKPEPVEAEPA